MAVLNTLRFLSRHPLTARNPLRALTRYIQWQIASRIAPGPVVVKFVNDVRLVVRPGMTGATGNVYAGLHEFEDMAFVLHALRRGELFIDVGANVGSYTVLAAGGVGARVIAFEPVPSTWTALRDNIHLNALDDRVDARATGIGSRSQIVRMTVALDTTNHVLAGNTDVEAQEDTVEVPIVSLDDALRNEEPFMVKLDIEGYELEALLGAPQILASPSLQAIIMEINSTGQRYGRSNERLEAHVRAEGFHRYRYFPFQRRLTEYVEGDESPTANAIFVRDIAMMEKRVREASPFEVLGQRV